MLRFGISVSASLKKKNHNMLLPISFFLLSHILSELIFRNNYPFVRRVITTLF